jgi:adenylate kinase family enzyme
MKKIMILGCCGAGKSTFARQLHHQTGLPLIYLDKEYWQSNWVEMDTEIWQEKMQELVEKTAWIMDGNYGGTLDIRLQAADTIIYLDRSRWLCLYRVLKRIFVYYGRSRPDMNEGCKERFDWEFIKYVYYFNDKKRPKILARISNFAPPKQIFIFNSQKEIQTFLNNF